MDGIRVIWGHQKANFWLRFGLRFGLRLSIQSLKIWLVRGLVKFVPAVV